MAEDWDKYEHPQRMLRLLEKQVERAQKTNDLAAYLDAALKMKYFRQACWEICRGISVFARPCIHGKYPCRCCRGSDEDKKHHGMSYAFNGSCDRCGEGR